MPTEQKSRGHSPGKSGQLRLQFLSRCVLAIAAGMLTACVSPVERIRMDTGVTDRPDDHRIEFRYTNTTGRLLCVSPETWPEWEGLESTNATLIVAGERFPVIQSRGFGVKFGAVEDVRRRIQPGEEIVGELTYGDFNLPERLWNAPKIMDFVQWAEVCKPINPSKRAG